MQLRAWGLGFLAGAALASYLLLSCATGHAQRAPLALEGPNDVQKVVEAIEEGIRLGLPRAWAWRVARCESRFNASAYNRRSGASGLYQFMPATWRHTPQGQAGMSVFDPYANARGRMAVPRWRAPALELSLSMPPVARPALLTPSSMLSFRAGDLLDALTRRATRHEVGAVCRRDLRRYYWLLAVALESAPPVTEATVDTLVARVSAALEQPSAGGDLSAPLFGCLDLLPGWNALQLLALADRLETLARRPGGLRGARASSHGSEALGVRLVRVGGEGRVKVR